MQDYRLQLNAGVVTVMARMALRAKAPVAEHAEVGIAADQLGGTVFIIQGLVCYLSSCLAI